MQGIDTKPLVELAVVEVLEAMCFISSEDKATEEAGLCQPDWICGELDFVGCLNGSFGIAVPPSTSAIITANFLGEDESTLTSEQTMEVIGELTNMICGTLLAHLDPRNTFSLSPPRSDHFDKQDHIYKELRFTTFKLEEGIISTWLNIRDRA